MPAKPRPLPPDITVTLRLPAPMAWRLQEVAEETYGIRSEQLALMAIARSLRKPRGPQTDLKQDWEVYSLWRQRLPITKIAEQLGIAPKTVSTRMQAMGLRSVYEDYRKGNASVISQKGWDTRRKLREQAERARQDEIEQDNGERGRKQAQARERAAQRRKAADAAGEGEAA